MDLFSDYQVHYKTDNQINSVPQYYNNEQNFKQIHGEDVNISDNLNNRQI